MDAIAFVQELDAFKVERLAPIVGAGHTSLLDGAARRCEEDAAGRVGEAGFVLTVLVPVTAAAGILTSESGIL